MKRTGMMIVALVVLLAAPAFAQDVARGSSPRPAQNSEGVKPSLPPATEKPAAAAPKPVPAPAPVAAPEFLAKWDRFLTLLEARRDAEQKRARYEAARDVLDEHIAMVRQNLLAQLPEGYDWDAARRVFVQRPTPPVVAPASPPAPEKPQGEKP